jgi:hypothetical protein
MARNSPKHAGPRTGAAPAAPSGGRSRAVPPGRMPVSEFAFDRAGAGSPFGDDLVLPLPVDRLTYVHPEPVNHGDPTADAG